MDLVMTSNMIWGKTPLPLCDFVQWLYTEQSQQDKDHVERQARWSAQRWQRMLHEEQMEEKRKKNQEEIQKRIVEVERQKEENYEEVIVLHMPCFSLFKYLVVRTSYASAL